MAAQDSLSVVMHHDVWFSGDSGPIHIVGRAGGENSDRENHDAAAGKAGKAERQAPGHGGHSAPEEVTYDRRF
ncbi:hypothetical protein NB703_002411 [Pantoea ananatis]|uniref:Uncharacterized protein n=1 Tax=Pantoea ananas TaxID=553 RepID=A0AAJ1CZ51_PANAN|nr:hypothetical protein [Pantoea ananatis]MCW0340939.1 hypothetical protein [Pantoea ananatis]MCW0344318.1 hypothetical protein [Pantoea ananatis]MCW0359308.1 hypothetical protein [Pantoea ananatis]MCW0364011.1 hypothetical protein [Pantoea ananatis]